MSFTREDAALDSNDDGRTVFRYDYPEAAADEWAVFWEVSTDVATEVDVDTLDDPSELATGWFAISDGAVVELADFE